MKRLFFIAIAVIALYMCGISTQVVQAKERPLGKYWTENSEVFQSLIKYIEKTTNKDSTYFIPVEDRIAVFDLDGTLMNENYPRCFEWMMFVDYAMTHPVPDDVKSTAQEILDTTWKAKPENMSYRQAEAAAKAYAGLTPAEIFNYSKKFKNSEAEGFNNLRRGDAWYLPMIEVVEYLQRNQFTIYIVSASETFTVRAIVDGKLNIPPQNVIGTIFGLKAKGQTDEADMNYTFKCTDDVVFSGEYYGENAKQAKVISIMRQIGKQPVLAFGNSSGDSSMTEYVITNNPYLSESFMVVNDDCVREYGNKKSAEKMKKSCAEHGWKIISMNDDFATIYGEDVTRKSVNGDGVE